MSRRIRRALVTVAFALLCSVTIAAVSPFSLPVGAIVLDAGHGGHDPGAIATDPDGKSKPLVEKDIVLDVTVQTADLLMRWYPDLQVVLTRSDDQFVSLQSRADIASQLDPGTGKSTLLVSIHANASHTPEASGVEFLIKRSDKRIRFLDQNVPDWALFRYADYTTNELNQLLNRENVVLAATIRDRFLSRFPESRDRGIKEQDLWILNASKVPSVLVELAFMTHPVEGRNLANPSWRSEAARALAEGIADYINRYRF